MNISFNPKDTNTFAPPCLDRTVKIWSLGSSQPNFTLEAHGKGVSHVEFYLGNDKPYLVTCGDDRKVWGYLSKPCVQTMEGHTNNVSFAIFHPSLPTIIPGSEDGTVKIWNVNTYRIEKTPSYALERAWCVALRKMANEVAVGYDEGVIVIKLGKDEPTLSADAQGKMVYTKAGSVPHSAWDGFEGRQTCAASGQVNRLLGGISDIHHTFSERTLGCCCWQWWMDHLHCSRVEEQGLWKRCIIRLGTGFEHIRRARVQGRSQVVQEFQGSWKGNERSR